MIENLNDVDTDVVFIKNIDNVVPSTSRKATIRYKKIIGGVLVEVQKKIAEYLAFLCQILIPLMHILHLSL